MNLAQVIVSKQAVNVFSARNKKDKSRLSF